MTAEIADSIIANLDEQSLCDEQLSLFQETSMKHSGREYKEMYKAAPGIILKFKHVSKSGPSLKHHKFVDSANLKDNFSFFGWNERKKMKTAGPIKPQAKSYVFEKSQFSRINTEESPRYQHSKRVPKISCFSQKLYDCCGDVQEKILQKYQEEKGQDQLLKKIKKKWYKVRHFTSENDQLKEALDEVLSQYQYLPMAEMIGSDLINFTDQLLSMVEKMLEEFNEMIQKMKRQQKRMENKLADLTESASDLENNRNFTKKPEKLLVSRIKDFDSVAFDPSKYVESKTHKIDDHWSLPKYDPFITGKNFASPIPYSLCKGFSGQGKTNKNQGKNKTQGLEVAYSSFSKQQNNVSSNHIEDLKRRRDSSNTAKDIQTNSQNSCLKIDIGSKMQSSSETPKNLSSQKFIGVNKFETKLEHPTTETYRTAELPSSSMARAKCFDDLQNNPKANFYMPRGSGSALTSQLHNSQRKVNQDLREFLQEFKANTGYIRQNSKKGEEEPKAPRDLETHNLDVL